MKTKITLFLLLNLLGMNILLAQDANKAPGKSDWITYDFGTTGFHIDLPKDPGKYKEENKSSWVTEWTDGKLKVLIRQFFISSPQFYDPDERGKNYFQTMQQLGKMGDQQLLFIEPRMIGGLEARLIRTYSKQKVRQFLLILGHSSEWVIDVESDPGDAKTLDRIFNSIRFDFYLKSFHKRQTLGKNGFTFAPIGDKLFATKFLEFADDPNFEKVEQGIAEHLGGFAVFQEFYIKDGVKFTLGVSEANFFVTNVLEGMMGGSDVKAVAKLKHNYKIKLNGTDALHCVYEVDTGNADENAPPLIIDLIIFNKNGKMTSLLVATNFKEGEEARFARTQLLNSVELKN